MGANPTAELRCSRCGAVAAVVGRGKEDGVTVTGFLGNCWHATKRLGRKGNADLDRALAAADPAALYGIDLEFAPCWCPECGVSYCRDHWRLDLVSDDDHPGWYDATYGVCPHGHRRLLDD